MNWRVRADFPTPPEPTMITLCRELDAASLPFLVLAIFSVSLSVTNSNVWLLSLPLDLNIKKPLSLAYILWKILAALYTPRWFFLSQMSLFSKLVHTSHEFTVVFKTWIWQGMSCLSFGPRLPKTFVLFREWMLSNEATLTDAANRNVWQIF